MIRTSIILSPRQEAADRLYFHANGLQIDVAAASQLIDRTSHRPVQIYSATRTRIRQQAQTLTSQTGFQGQRWQRLMDILDRLGSDALPALFRDGELSGEWIAALDENRLNALVSERFTFYLFRQGSLRELRPVGQIVPEGQEAALNHFRIQVNKDDQVFILPIDLILPSLLSEAEQILSGIQQLPVRLSELGARLRERGVTAPFTGWIALQVLRADPEYTVPERGFRSWLAGRRKPETDTKGPGFSDGPSLPDSSTSSGAAERGGEGDAESGAPAGEWSPRIPKIAMIAVIVVVVLAAILLIYRAVFPRTVETTQTTPSIPSVTTTARPTPTMTPRPTTTATTTAPLPEWYVIARRLNLREEPNLTSPLIRTLTTGQSVFILEQTNAEWTKVRTPEGETGYVYAAYISKDKPAG